MKNRLLGLLGGSILALTLASGCANSEQEPPPEDDMDVEDPVMEDQTDGRGGNGNPDDNNSNTNDENQNGDGDAAIDDNTSGEEGIEDETDINDKNNEDK